MHNGTHSQHTPHEVLQTLILVLHAGRRVVNIKQICLAGTYKYGTRLILAEVVWLVSKSVG